MELNQKQFPRTVGKQAIQALFTPLIPESQFH